MVLDSIDGEPLRIDEYHRLLDQAAAASGLGPAKWHIGAFLVESGAISYADGVVRKKGYPDDQEIAGMVEDDLIYLKRALRIKF